MGAQRFVQAIGAAAVATALVALAAAPALAQVPPPTTAPAAEPVPGDATTAPDLGQVLAGTVPSVSGSAKGGFGDGDTLDVTLTLTNATAKPLVVAVPRGALFKSEDPSQQTAVAAGPMGEDPTTVQAGVDPTITVVPGTSTVALRAFCGQHHDYGPVQVVPLRYAGVAQAPLPTVLTNLAQLRPDKELAERAVWWVTDDPEYPVPASLQPFLAGVDAKAFAAEPRQVVPDPQYTPDWRLEEFGTSPSPAPSGGGGPSLLPLFLVLALSLGGVAVAVSVTRSGRRVSAVTPVRHTASGVPAGWLPDPSDPRWLRYWDGTSWTTHTRLR